MDLSRSAYLTEHDTEYRPLSRRRQGNTPDGVRSVFNRRNSDNALTLEEFKIRYGNPDPLLSKVQHRAHGTMYDTTQASGR